MGSQQLQLYVHRQRWQISESSRYWLFCSMWTKQVKSINLILLMPCTRKTVNVKDRHHFRIRTHIFAFVRCEQPLTEMKANLQYSNIEAISWRLIRIHIEYNRNIMDVNSVRLEIWTDGKEPLCLSVTLAYQIYSKANKKDPKGMILITASNK